MLRNYPNLSIDFSLQLKHVKRQLFSDDLFQPIHFNDVPHFANSSIVIVGMTHNQEKSINTILQQLDNMACLFSHAAILIFESGSTDRTPQLLASWQANNHHNLCARYTPLSPHITKKLLVPAVEPGLIYKTISRLDRYAAFRNYTLHEALQFAHFDYMANIDMDILGIDIKRILQEFEVAERTRNASVMCVNGMRQMGLFHDSLASILFNKSWTYPMDKIDRTNIIWEGGRFTRMISCFGGMAIYRMRDIVDTKCGYMLSREALQRYPELERYQDLDPPGPLTLGICEHIPLHYCLHTQQRKIFLAKDAYLYYGYYH